MDFKICEELALLAKENNEEAKEMLVKEFEPFIRSVAKRTFIHGFDYNDIVSEGYITLFKCIKMYNPNSHRFVGYTVSAIKNNINYIIEKSLRHESTEGASALTMTDKLEHILLSDKNVIDEKLSELLDEEMLTMLEDTLSEEEMEIINLIILRGYSVKEYSLYRQLKYSTVSQKKQRLLKKIRTPLENYTTKNIAF